MRDGPASFCNVTKKNPFGLPAAKKNAPPSLRRPAFPAFGRRPPASASSFSLCPASPVSTPYGSSPLLPAANARFFPRNGFSFPRNDCSFRRNERNFGRYKCSFRRKIPYRREGCNRRRTTGKQKRDRLHTTAEKREKGTRKEGERAYRRQRTEAEIRFMWQDTNNF